MSEEQRYAIAKLDGVQELYEAWTPLGGPCFTPEPWLACQFRPEDLRALQEWEYLVPVSGEGRNIELGDPITRENREAQARRILEVWDAFWDSLPRDFKEEIAAAAQKAPTDGRLIVHDFGVHDEFGPRWGTGSPGLHRPVPAEPSDEGGPK